jgi:hypothetical protein
VATDKEILAKADALLRRNAVGAPDTGADTGTFPVLTDLVEMPSATAGHAPHSDLARDVFRRVMVEVEVKLAADLERKLAHQLIPQVHAAVASAIGDLRQDLANAIGDAVAEALKQRTVK